MLISNYTERFFGFKEEYVTQQECNEERKEFIFSITLPQTPHQCPCCHNTTQRVKDYRTRIVRLGIQQDYRLIARYRQRRYYCPRCGKSFSEQNPFVGCYQRLSIRCKEILMQRFCDLLSYTQIAKDFGLSPTTVIRYFSAITYRKIQQLPVTLSIDEFKGNAAGQRYQVSITDPQSHSILDILPARNTEAMLRYFATFTHAQRQQVKFFVMDMSSQFRYVVETMFPNANIVADRYHVTRLVTWAVEAVRKREQRKLAAASRTLKQNKAVLLKQSHRLTEQDSIKLSEIFRISPDLKTAYKLKQYFYILYSQLGKENIQRALILWLEEVKNSGLPEFNSLLKSMSQWNDYIVNAFLLPYSNGFIEGCNNKIKVLKRISFGLRNFERFRVRILLLNAKRSYADKNSA